MSFFDNIRKSASDAAFQAQKVARVQRQQSTVNAAERERDQAVLEVGRKAVEKVRSGEVTEPDLVAVVQSLSELDAKVQAAKDELERIRNEQPPSAAPQPTYPQQAQPQSGQMCAHCGSPLPPGAVFCTTCGARVESAQPRATAQTVQPEPPMEPEPPLASAVNATPPEPASGPRYCTSCGAPLSEGQKFCTSCGAPA